MSRVDSKIQIIRNSMINLRQQPRRTFAEFFAGIGLMRMGLESQGWKVAFANDLCPDKYEMYRAHFDDADDHFVVEDIHKLNVTEVPTVTLATASFPCNDLSLAGARAGLAGSQSSAGYGFVRILKEMKGRRPPLVLLENVTGFLTSHDGSDFREVLLALNALGYAVDAFIIDAVHFVPQSRQRLFVVGRTHKREPTLRVEERTKGADFYESKLRPAALAQFIFDNPDIRWSLKELPQPPSSTVKLTSLLENLPHNREEWWSEGRTTYLLN